MTSDNNPVIRSLIDDVYLFCLVTGLINEPGRIAINEDVEDSFWFTDAI